MQLTKGGDYDGKKDCIVYRGGSRLYRNRQKYTAKAGGVEKLPVLKVGRKVLIKTDILEKFMEVNEGCDLRDKGSVKTVTRNAAI